MISRKKSFNILQPIQMRVSDQNKPVVTVVQGSQFHLLLKQHLLANGPFWDAEQGNIVLLFPYPFFSLTSDVLAKILGAEGERERGRERERG